jgi:hypothetical protein
MVEFSICPHFLGPRRELQRRAIRVARGEAPRREIPDLLPRQLPEKKIN